MLPSLSGLPGLSGTSAASATGGTVGDFNFAPGKVGNQLLIAIAAGIIVALLMRK